MTLPVDPEPQLFDVLWRLALPECDALLDAAGSHSRLRLACRAARDWVDGAVRELALSDQAGGKADGHGNGPLAGSTDAEMAAVPLRHFLPALPARWPRCTKLHITHLQKSAAVESAVRALLGAQGGARQLHELVVDGAPKFGPTDGTLATLFLTALALACPGLRKLQLLSVAPGEELDFAALSNLHHLEELVLPDCRALKHVAQLAGCPLRQLTVVNMYDDGDLDADACAPRGAFAVGAGYAAWPPDLPRLVGMLAGLRLLPRLQQLELREFPYLPGAALLSEHVLLALVGSGALPPSLATLTVEDVDADGRKFVDRFHFQHGQLVGAELSSVEAVDRLLELSRVLDTLAAAPAAGSAASALAPPVAGGAPLQLVVHELGMEWGDNDDTEGLLEGEELQAVRELVGRCGSVRVGLLRPPVHTPAQAVSQAVQLFGVPQAVHLQGCAVGSTRLRLAGGGGAARGSAASGGGVVRGTAAPAEGGEGHQAAGAHADGGAAEARGMGARRPQAGSEVEAPAGPDDPPDDAYLPLLLDLLCAWVNSSEEFELAAPALPGARVRLLGIYDGALAAWCSAYGIHYCGCYPQCLLRPLGAVAVPTASAGDAAALCGLLPREVAGQPLRVLRGTTQLGDWATQVLQRYLDAPGSSATAAAASLQARLLTALSAWEDLHGLLHLAMGHG